MYSLQIPLTPIAYSSLLKECTSSKSLVEGSEIHAHINKTSLYPGIHIENQIILMYMACRCPTLAYQVFDKMSHRNTDTWQFMITGLMDLGMNEETLDLYIRMHQEMVRMKPNTAIQGGVLRACAFIEDVGLGKQIHAKAIKSGSSKDTYLGCCLVDFYVEMKCLVSARKAFDEICKPNVVAWTAMIVGCAREGEFHGVLEVFREMERVGKRGNCYTYSCLLGASGKMGHVWMGKQVQARVIKVGVEKDVYVGSSIVGMYGKCGFVEDARLVFDGMREKNAVSWNAMLCGYAKNGCCDEAIKLLYEMRCKGLEPPQVMVNEVAIACGA
ncbi:hypothetical protein AMTR_s00003p00175270 [Amborella trichopoda]|uniref:Pentacotripeptide-repeat region of PRORP domain-containing protein n=2 Tax=Amborella trichopoda TaxID=13333 RepID=W1P5P8_AMBTC|nr:hypothetical protein AMTR_s00003p00175270 [Amborella trichopoda]